MKQATEPGFYWDPKANQEVEIRAGQVRPDGHQDVLRCPTIFRDVDIEEPAPAKPAAKPAAAPSKSVKG